jgi:beta-1,4-mannosyl-glycoprotein beta-1,4-N-acetylglucosaminyltransferase
MGNGTVIFDCTQYFNERDVLEIRLGTIGPYVDHFIIVEADATHRGNPKEYTLPDVLPGMPYAEKVIHVRCQMRDLGLGPWQAENYQRNAAEEVLRLMAMPPDWVLVGDIDEIPHPRVFSNMRCGVLEQRMSMAYLNRFRQTPIWNGTVITRRVLMDTLQAVRNTRNSASRITDGGWHFTYMGGPAAVQHKLLNFAHSEYSVPPFTDIDYIQRRMFEGAQDLFQPGNEEPQFFPAPLSDLPEYVVEHQYQFKHLLWNQ